MVATGSTPERFGRHMRRAIELASLNPSGEQVVVIKSWNEWAEGNYLEPDTEFGLGRLEALRTELARPRRRLRLLLTARVSDPVPTMAR